MTSPASSTDPRGLGSGRERFGLAWMAAAAACLLWSHRAAFGFASGTASRSEGLDPMLFEPSMMEPALALVVFGLLALRRRERIVECASAGRGTAWGIAVFGLGLATLLWSRQIDADRLLVPSLMLHLLGAALMAGGGPLVRALAMPFAALATAVPLPPQLVHALVFPLQLGTVSLASTLLDLFGRSHAVLGDLIVYGGDRFQVIEGCSGFKTIVSLVLAAIVYADFIGRSARMKALLVALALPIGMLANGVRVLILILGRIEPESPEHTAYGLLAIVAGVVALAVTEMSWTRLVPIRAGAGTDVSEPLRSGRSRLGRVAASMVLSMLVAELAPQGRWPTVASDLNIETLPEVLDGRTSRPLDVDDAWLGSARFGHRIYRSYDTDSPQATSIRVFVGLEDAGSAERTGDSPRTAIPRSGWRTLASRSAIESPIARWERWVIDYPNQGVFVQRWRSGFAPWGLEGLVRWIGLDRAGFMEARRSPLVIRLELDADLGDEEREWMRLRQFAAQIEAWQAASAH